MPAHKVDGPSSTVPRPKSGRVKARAKRKAAEAACVVAAAQQPSLNSPTKPQVKDDLFVNITVGNYTAQMNVATLQLHQGALMQAYSQYYARNARNPDGRIELNLDGDGDSFRLVEYFMTSGRLPPNLDAERLAYLRRSAATLKMQSLENEARELYPLRQKISSQPPKESAQVCSYIADVLTYAAALVRTDGNREELLSLLENLVAASVQPVDDIFVQAAMSETEVRRSSLMFAYLVLKRMSRTKRLYYFTEVAQGTPTAFFTYGDVGEQLVRAGRIDMGNLFLQKAKRINSPAEQALSEQNIRTRFLADKRMNDDILGALQMSYAAAGDGGTCSTLGRALLLKERFDEATTVLLQALQYGVPKEMLGSTHHALGACYHHKKRLHDALLHYRQAHDHAPYDSGVCASAGTALHELEQFEEATQWRSLLVLLEPGWVHAHRSLGETLMAQGHLAEAIVRLDLAEIVNSKDLATLQCKVHIGECLSDWDYAIVNQRKILTLAFYDSQQWRKLAYFYTRDDQPIAAHGALQQSERLDAANSRVARAASPRPAAAASSGVTLAPEAEAEPVNCFSASTSPTSTRAFDTSGYLQLDPPEFSLDELLLHLGPWPDSPRSSSPE